MATGKRNLHVGHNVLVADDNIARNQWALGRVENVFPGADGLVSIEEVRAKGATLQRPVAKLCLLEGVNDE